MKRLLGLTLALALTAPLAAQPAAKASYRARTPDQEVIYFVLPDRFDNGDPSNDRGGLTGDRLVTGYDPAHKGFYHGGDLKGLTRKLDYIQGMGITAIWFAPVFKNKPVQGPKGDESAGYHGYWITDFTTIDPHFGTEAEFKAFVDAAHARGIKVYMDIIVNHTADVIQYREAGDYSYRSKADFPFSRRGGVAGAPINPGFMGDHRPGPANWSKLADPSFAYTPFVPTGEERVKVPAWLNDPIYYHNRGNSNWVGESALYGDFVGLDDLATEHPRVVSGMIAIYASWIDRFGIDGFRIDTAKHVNAEFWQAFIPAMQARAKAKGIPNFHIFAEVATGDPDPALLARWSHIANLTAPIDMAFAAAAQRVVSGMIAIYASWIDRFGIDGFRIDTAKHVNAEFWQAFIPAMQARAKAKGIPNFHIFAEVATGDPDPALLARWSHIANLTAPIDMAFAAAAQRVVSGKAGTDVLARMFEDDPIYKGGEKAALRLPTFLGNHDFGRFSMFVKQANPGISQDELLARTMLGHAMMLTLRGVPTIYSGDEQGFVSDGNDQLAREDMFASTVAAYNDNDLIGTDATTAQANFDVRHPLYRLIAELSAVRRSTPALTGGLQKIRAFSDKPGLLAISRFDPKTGREVVLVFNTSAGPITNRIAVDPRSLSFSTLAGQCTPSAAAPGSLSITLPAFGFAVCAAKP